MSSFRPDDYDAALNKSLSALSRRAHSELEVTTALLEAEFDAQTIGRVLSRLRELGLVDDREFARQVAEFGASRRGESNAAIEARLRSSGVAPADIQPVLAELDSSDFDRAFDLARRRRSRLSRLPADKARRRLAGYLAGKGYDWELVGEVVSLAMGERTDVPID